MCTPRPHEAWQGGGRGIEAEAWRLDVVPAEAVVPLTKRPYSPEMTFLQCGVKGQVGWFPRFLPALATFLPRVSNETSLGGKTSTATFLCHYLGRTALSLMEADNYRPGEGIGGQRDGSELSASDHTGGCHVWFLYISCSSSSEKEEESLGREENCDGKHNSSWSSRREKWSALVTGHRGETRCALAQ